MNKPFLDKKVQAIEVKEKPISKLLAEMGNTAYQGKNLGKAVDVWESMVKEKDLTIVLGLSGSMSTAGQWKIVNWLIEKRFIDVIVSTGANVSEDIIEAMGFSYWQGSHIVNDQELLKEDLNRYYDVYGKEIDYRQMEDLLTDFSKSSIEILGADITGQSIHTLNISNSIGWCLVLGNESHGISKSSENCINNKVTIPGVEGMESLNVSVAGGILLHVLTSPEVVTN